MPLWAPSWVATEDKFRFSVSFGNNAVGMPGSATAVPDLSVSGLDLVAASYLSGQPRHLLSAWGAKGGYAFRMWRIWSSLGMLEPDNYGGIKHSPEYKELDATEKNQMNYALGGTVTKAYAESKLGVPWLAHLSLAERAGYKIEFDGNRRPDYIGYANNRQDLVIAEAKGRQRSDRRLKNELDKKTQGNAVKSVDNVVPAKRYGVLTEAPPEYPVSIYAVEPPEFIKTELKAIDWMREYYKFALQLEEECAGDPRPGAVEDWASVELQVPNAISDWLDRPYHPQDQNPENQLRQEMNAWELAMAQARDEAEQKSPTNVVRSDLLIVHA